MRAARCKIYCPQEGSCKTRFDAEHHLAVVQPNVASLKSEIALKSEKS